MLSVRLKFIRTILGILLLCISGRMFSQAEEMQLPVYDTSGYIPSFYPGALDNNLMIAAAKGYVSEIERLIIKGADINAESDQGATPLIFAVSNNHPAAVESILDFNPYLDKVTKSYETPLLISVKNGNFEITEALIRAGADIDFPDRFGATPLHHASLYGFLNIVDLLLYYNATVDEKTDQGTTPLLASIWAGFTDVADLLIQNGANLEISDNEGFTPFLMASFYGDTILMDLLYKKGANILAINNAKNNALTISILTGNTSVMSYLFRISDKWNNFSEETINPYAVATKYRRKEAVNILEENNIPGHLTYGFDQVAITASERIGFHDLYSGFSIAFKEPYLNFGFIAGCDLKLWDSRLLIKNSENLYYQYKDRGSVAYAGLFKDFALTDYLDKYNLSLSASLMGGYTFGNKLKGTLITPEQKVMIIPSISLKIIKKNLTLSAGFEYIKTGFYKDGPVWFRLGCSYNHFFDKVRTYIKPIKWY
jgi:ankyrin repeat protein